jgi:hypothetical protein
LRQRLIVQASTPYVISSRFAFTAPFERHKPGQFQAQDMPDARQS